jgi:hypothetical protein
MLSGLAISGKDFNHKRERKTSRQQLEKTASIQVVAQNVRALAGLNNSTHALERGWYQTE